LVRDPSVRKLERGREKERWNGVKLFATDILNSSLQA